MMIEEANAGTHTEGNPYQEEALFLAKSCPAFQKERDWLMSRLAGSWVYTVDDAIRDLDNITVSYEGERVQSSNISNPTERIALKITSTDYMARKQREMDAEKKWCEERLQYLTWGIGVVDTAMKERMTAKERAIFQRLFFREKTYREIRQAYKGKLYDHQISTCRKAALEAIADEINLCSYTEEAHQVVRLTAEWKEEQRKHAEAECGQAEEAGADSGCGEQSLCEEGDS